MGASVSDVDLDFDKPSYETSNTGLCKYILNLAKQAGNNASRGELGRFPLCNKIWSLVVKYWMRLEKGTDNIFLDNAYECAKTHNNIWLQQIRGLMRKVGLGHIWSETHRYTPSQVSKIFERRINDIYIQNWYATQSTSPRFKSSLQHEYSMSPYLINLSNIDARNAITRLRLDMNMLRECKGRQARSDNRACPSCKAHTESVTHFLLVCPTFNTIRAKFVNAMQSVKMHEYNLQVDAKYV